VAAVAGGGGEPPFGSAYGAVNGGGLGGFTRPLGVYVVKEGKVRWVPADLAILIAITALIALRRLIEVGVQRWVSLPSSPSNRPRTGWEVWCRGSLARVTRVG
jgi:hypothetical protein